MKINKFNEDQEQIEKERILLVQEIYANASIINEYLYKFDKKNLDIIIDKTIQMLERLKFIDTVNKYNL
jgi:Holliday junction resolvasome RuvABC ATP-dependent DNA helicase subunit